MHILQNLRTGFVTILAVGLVVMSVGRGDAISDIQLVTGAHQQDIVRWEVTHFMDKWLHRATTVFSRPSHEQRLTDVAQFFSLGDQLNQAKSNLTQALATQSQPSESATADQQLIDSLNKERASLQPTVEETLEGAISQAAADEGVIDELGPLRWPPVDFTFEPGALVLVRSPKDRIERLSDLLLNPDISTLDQIAIENKVEADEPGISALIVRIGGVATYPSQVSPNGSLLDTLNLASHEWLHQWLIFKPLGRKWFAGGELQSINETVANIFGEENGDKAYEILTGQHVNRPPWTPPTLQPKQPIPPGVFDYTTEMRKTRSHLEDLLNAGKVDEASAYLEQRREEFVAHGYDIRKLNTAWFAFYGTYADSAASISPIEGQLRAIRADSGSLSAFLQRVSVIDKPGQLEQMALAAGWVPIDTSTGLPLNDSSGGSATTP